ncbi:MULTISPECIES: Xaa-Pro aminopeptidase [unclassified Gilliamella]|uniref:Xaa-Pro aminopeptidase n=1 Tax=unclassified Gilliamella TaxID=2685620 RepID=UPI00226ADAF1|nr:MULTISPECIES: Xaa-Pro aminopeptidase [unclassified Gilliamella]MCX8601830.1 Xaa-Pro aminopeptidase [Gilliamella sp. B3722]MCX8607970.1 Xaa-Pro aminopeptidase [Gilliamella sp. B3771]MCX8611095.1 Xaa-Pro aminopeptidase [Gilliamella sp. B3891]MCX8613564.1 Xaa-Pro aminopeptidase [Gilliamella sp. B3773]MCX8614442.1 Xaa-Pro aminopeptidase [Gilliamella sp. B3770]
MPNTDIKTELFARREKLLAQMVPNSVALFFAAPEMTRSNDTHYPYRQDSDFWYFTQFSEPQAVLAIIKQSNDAKYVLFNRKKDPLAETWTGYRLGQQAALEAVLVDEAYLFDDIATVLPDILDGKTTIYHADQHYDYADTIVKQALMTLREGARVKRVAPSTVIDWRLIVHQMRMFKSEYELQILRKACDISAKAHMRAMQKCQPLLYEYQLEAEILHEFAWHGARFPSYNTIVGSGNNGCILHYENNCDQLKNGDLVLIDAGCEYQYYAGDITRTFPINGEFSQAQRDIYDIVLAAQYHAIELFKPGTTILAVNELVVRIMVEGLVKLGIMQGDVDSLIANKAYSEFYMHGLGHWLGIDVHDVGQGRDCILQPGMVLTVEPGLYINKDADVPEHYKGIGIRIEDNILITPSGNEVLTAKVPKDPLAIEALMKKPI